MVQKYTPAVRRAIAAYGEAACIRAFELNTKHGEGASSIALNYPLPGVNTTRQADSAINAGRAIVASQSKGQGLFYFSVFTLGKLSRYREPVTGERLAELVEWAIDNAMGYSLSAF